MFVIHGPLKLAGGGLYDDEESFEFQLDRGRYADRTGCVEAAECACKVAASMNPNFQLPLIVCLSHRSVHSLLMSLQNNSRKTIRADMVFSGENVRIERRLWEGRSLRRHRLRHAHRDANGWPCPNYTYHFLLLKIDPDKTNDPLIISLATLETRPKGL